MEMDGGDLLRARGSPVFMRDVCFREERFFSPYLSLASMAYFASDVAGSHPARSCLHHSYPGANRRGNPDFLPPQHFEQLRLAGLALGGTANQQSGQATVAHKLVVHQFFGLSSYPRCLGCQ